MNVWIINPDAVPPSLGGLTRHYYFKKFLEKKGHTVTIFSGSNIYNRDLNLFKKNEKGFFKQMVFDDEEFVFIRVPNNKSTLNRLYNIHLYCRRLKKLLLSRKFKKPDIFYISYSPEIEVGVVFTKLAKKMGIPCVVETRDIYPDTLSCMGVIKKNGLIYKMTKSIVKSIFYRSDALFYTMDCGYKYILDNKWDLENGGKIDLKHVYTINNGVDLDSFNSQTNKVFLDSDLDQKSIKNIVYTGSVGSADEIDRLLDIAKLMKNTQYQFLIWGNGKKVPEIINRIKEENIKNVVYKGVVKGTEIPGLLKKADILLMIQQSLDVLKYGISQNKSYQYLASGKPMLVLIDTTFPPVDQGGLIVSDSDNEICAKIIDSFLFEMTPEKYNSMCINNINQSKKYNYSLISEKLESVLKTIIESKRNNYEI